MNVIRPSCRVPTQQAMPISLPIRPFTTCSARPAKPSGPSRKQQAAKLKMRKRQKKHQNYKMPELKDLKQYALCDAMQFIRAFECGRDPKIPKYDLALRFKTKKDGPIVRNQIRLPHAVKTDIRVCALVDPNSKAGKDAKAAGAQIVGLQDVFEDIKENRIRFDRCVTTPECLPVLSKAGMPRILGPRGLMPNVKLGTVTDNVGDSVRNMMGGSTYRERQGVIRMAIGQLAFSPEQLRDNVKAFIAQVKKEAGQLSEAHGLQKEVFEVVLSSTNSPGFSLNGEFRSPDSVPTKLLAAA